MASEIAETDLTEVELTEVFEYLDELRESGRTNMFGAARFIQEELLWDRKGAADALKLWMSTFSRDLSVAERVTMALSA